ncbi:MAG: hypothetical protein ABII82_07530 [Verrucomicrobiota bacterium]
MAAGAWITLAGLKVIEIDPRKLHVPFWVFTLVGIVFLLPGLLFCFWSFKAWLAERRRLQNLGANAHSPALRDHAWNTREWRTDRWAAAKRAGFAALFMTAFMTVVVHIVFFERGIPVVVKVGSSLFILAAVWCWFLFVRELLRGWKYGSSAVGYDRFPLPLGNTVNLRWLAPSNLLVIESGQVALRCVREWTETVGTGKHRTIKLRHESLWECVRAVEPGTMLRPTDDIELSFNVPPDQPGTCLSDPEKTRFWEVEIKLAVPGLDFNETYLVPIYD